MRYRFILLFLLPFCLSCLWDRDTLAEEGKGRMNAIEIIVGWFDRYPPEYYQARLDRVLKEIQTTPEKLSLYDDAAVALDRLHRSSEAIALMAQKKAMMSKLRESGQTADLREHRYRYLANLGTFHVHDWIGRPKEIRDSDLTSLQKAEELIEAAIAYNPEAHFGREKYQLLAIQWLQKTPEQIGNSGPMGPNVRKLEKEEIDEALAGFLGMIKLGAAWESTDFFNIIAELLSAERSGTLSYLSDLRTKELEENGAISLHPHSHLLEFQMYGGPDPERRKEVNEWYPLARKGADERQQSRWAYLRKGFSEGRHPDTDPDFWNAWTEHEFPAMPGARFMDNFSFLKRPYYFIWIGLALGCTLLWIISLIRRKRIAWAELQHS